MEPYSVDFRRKIIDTREKDKISIRKIAKRFKTSKSFVKKILKQYKETGDIRPKQPGEIPQKKLKEEHLVTLAKILEQNNNATTQKNGELLAK
ncbi:MAG: hypothetical protein F6K10_14525 [Moorea sp. SIO2B7]|nr:hypothetical protein [Moorena sp. SIO2B7]